MKVLYFLNTANSTNWGSQATSAGMKHLVSVNYPNAEFFPFDFKGLPMKWFPFARKIPDILLLWCIKHKKVQWVKRILSWYGIDLNVYNNCDVVLFNGEGAIHDKSGHFFRLISSLYAFKASNKTVISMNQTVDVAKNGLHAQLLQLVYPQLDAVYAREPVSCRFLEDLGIKNTVIGDAAYALPLMSREEVDEISSRYDLPGKFIAVTGSSVLDRNESSVKQVLKVIDAIKSVEYEVVFMANTKTDLYIANKIKEIRDIRIVSYKNAKYPQAMAIIAKARILIGGRQHPNIFAAMYHTPFIGLDGNTHKMRGVMELLNYPYQSFSWDCAVDDITQRIDHILLGKIDFSQVIVPEVCDLRLS